jgi:DNA-binding NtrC family response regulator
MKKSKCILIVDDEANTRELLREVLEMDGHSVLEASDGEEALKVLESQSVDLLITDRNMPNMDGLKLLKTLHLQKRTVPALMLSAYGEEKMWGDAIGFGAIDYVLKPFKTDELLKIVRKALAGEKS